MIDLEGASRRLIADQASDPPPIGVLRRRARSRRRRRLVALSTLTAIVVVAALGILGRNRPTSVATSGPTASTTATASSAAAAGAGGRLAVSAAQFPTSHDGFVLVTETDSAGSPSGIWLEITTDGGRHWHAIRPRGLPAFQGAPMSFAMVSATTGWISDGQLWATTDRGATWTPQLDGRSVLALAVDGKTAWTEAVSGRFFESARPGAPFLALAANPPGAQVTSPVRTSPSVAYALAGNLQRTTDLVRTVDGGHHWTSLPLPCSSPNGRPASAKLLEGGPSGTLWLTCFVSAQLTDPSAGVVTVYTTSDQGLRWTRHGPLASTLREASRDGLLIGALAQLEPVSNQVAWAAGTGGNNAAAGPILRSTDMGRRWTDVLGQRLAPPIGLLRLGSLTATSPTAAWVTAISLGTASSGDGQHPVVLHSNDGGHHWHSAALPPLSG